MAELLKIANSDKSTMVSMDIEALLDAYDVAKGVESSEEEAIVIWQWALKMAEFKDLETRTVLLGLPGALLKFFMEEVPITPEMTKGFFDGMRDGEQAMVVLKNGVIVISPDSAEEVLHYHRADSPELVTPENSHALAIQLTKIGADLWAGAPAALKWLVFENRAETDSIEYLLLSY